MKSLQTALLESFNHIIDRHQNLEETVFAVIWHLLLNRPDLAQKVHALTQDFNRETPAALTNLYRNTLQYDTYEEAFHASAQDGYQNDSIVRVVVEKNAVYRELHSSNSHPTFSWHELRPVIATSLARNRSHINVIDFGGGGGNHYTVVRAVLDPSITLSWNVVETRAMAKEAKRLENWELRFFDCIEEASKNLTNVDLLFTSGALHCCAAPLETLERILKVQAAFLYICRTSFTHGEETLYVRQNSKLSDNGPGPLPAGFNDDTVGYPAVFVPKSKAEALISNYYDIRFSSVEDLSAYTVGHKTLDMYGYFASLKTT